MKLFVMRAASDEYNSENFETMKEVQIFASPDYLRKLGEFLIVEARRIEDFGANDFDHSHLRDYWKDWKEDAHPDVVLYPVERYKAK